MMKDAKAVDTLDELDLRNHAVWQFMAADEGDETIVRPVKRRPINHFGGKIVGTEVLFSGGRSAWAILGNIYPEDKDLTEQMISLSIVGVKWFTLARYFDFNYESRGPKALAELIGLSVDEIFPISYDIRKVTRNNSESLHGRIFKTPRIRLTLEELMAMSLG